MNESEHIAKSKKDNKAKTILFLVLFLALAIGLGVTGFLYYQTRQELYYLTTQAGQEEIAKREVATVTKQLGKITILPEEDPVIATIIEPDFLATQSAFYANSKKGDKLVVYPKAQKAYIYSPERNIIVNSGPLLMEQAPEGTEQSGTAPAAAVKPTVEVRNGSNTVGAATRLAETLRSQGYTVAEVKDAANKNYTGTTIFVRDSSAGATAANELVARTSGRVVTTLPEGEAAPTAQALVIIGN